MPAPYDRLLLPTYVPSLIISATHTALLILLPLYAIELGMSPALAAVIVGARGAGLLLFDVPSGILAGRYGDRAVLLIGLGLILAGTVILAMSGNAWLLGVGAFLNGAGFSAWMLGRQSYIADTCASAEIGRAMAVLGGVQRVGMAIGPVVFGALAAATSYAASFVAGAVITVLATVFVWGFCVEARGSGSGTSLSLKPTLDAMRAHAHVYLTAGWAALALQLMRSTRTLLVPLIGIELGLDAASVGLIFSISAVIDMSLFYPVGWVVDRHGRKWSAVPSLVLFSIGLALLPLASGFLSLLALGCLLGLANGIGTGIVMIIGADLSRAAADRSHFLGVWRLIGDIGMSAAPLLSAALLTFAGLGAASLVAAAIGMAGAVVMHRAVPETLERDRPEPG